MLSCGKCGASVTETAIYCSICGVKLAEIGAAPTTLDSPLNKAASALAKATGLEKSQPISRFRSLWRAVLLLAGGLLILTAYLVYRSQSSAQITPALNIVAPLDQVNRLVATGKNSLEQGDFKNAIAQFEEAAQLVPNDTDIILKLAYSYEAEGQIDNALIKYSRIIELDPKNVEARYQRAELQLNRGFWKEATEDLQYLEINAPSTEQGNRAKLLLRNFTATRTFGPAHGGQPRRGKGSLQLPEVGDSPPGLALTLPALVNGVPVAPPSASPSSEDHIGANALASQYKNQGQRYLNAKEYYKAIKELQDARKLTPDDGDLYYLLGQAYDSLKQYPQARRYYEQCDSGVYVQVARSAAQRARKNEQNELKKQTKK